MALLTNLLGDGVTEGVKKALSKSVKRTTKEAVSDAVSDTTSKALSKSLRNEIADEVTDAAIKKMPKNLTGAGISSLEKNAGSTLDGILGRSSGITLKNAKKPSLEELTGYKSLGNALEGLDMTVDDLGKGTYKGLSKRNLATVKESTREAADMLRSTLEEQTGGLTKSQLPKLNRQQYYEDTIGKLSNKGGTMKYADVPDYMKGHLVTANRGAGIGAVNNDEVLRELFGENMDLNDAYAKYEDIASSDMDANKIYTPENVDWGLGMQGKAKANAIEQDFADRLAGAREIPVEKITSGKKNIAVNRPTEMVAEAVEETAPAIENPALAEEIASLREKIGAKEPAAAGGMDGGSIGTAPTDVAGSEGFNVKLKNGQPTTITVGAGSVGSTKQQRAFRKLDDMTAKSLNANAKQYKGLMEKSGSIGGHYKTVAERARKEAIDQANISQKAQTALALREDIKQQGLQYAERNGVTIDLTGIDNTIGMSATQKRKLAELGLGLDDMLGGSSVVSPTQAEEIYKTLRDYAYNWSDSKDALTKMAGNACKKEANAVRDAIDNAMDNINIDYKTSLLEQAAENGEDPAYLRAIAGKGDFKFSDLRKDQSDWIKINDLAGNKIKAEPTINILGIDTGINNPFTAGGDKIKEKIYERQAYGAGGAGAGAAGGSGTPGGTGVPPTGTEGPINFETVGGQPSKLRSLLSKGKDAGLVGAGILGGLMLGGNGGGQPTAGGQTLADVLQANQMQQQQAQMGSMAGEDYANDPYAGMTVGGYTYDELADGYARALQAGDASAAESIAKLMGIIEDRATATLNRQKYESSLKSSSGNNNSASAVNVLSELYDLYNNIKSGTGPIAGNITNALNTVTGGGYNTEANTYWQVSRGALGKLIKGMGDTGALSEGDQKRALQMIPNVTDTREAAEQKFMALYNILSSAAQM
jgi:hypothetical protein